jgi:nitrogen regulatory protein PII
MKLLTAFVRTSRIDEVIQALHEAGAPGITVVVGVHAVDYDYLPIEFSWTPGELGKAPEVLEVQVVCREKDCDRLLDVLVEAAQTGLKGFTGDACFKGGCARPFAQNVCGGMDKDNVVF